MSRRKFGIIVEPPREEQLPIGSLPRGSTFSSHEPSNFGWSWLTAGCWVLLSTQILVLRVEIGRFLKIKQLPHSSRALERLRCCSERSISGQLNLACMKKKTTRLRIVQ